jgi:hypothetical protein
MEFGRTGRKICLSVSRSWLLSSGSGRLVTHTMLVGPEHLHRLIRMPARTP